MAFCTKCGKELPAGASFCPVCGAPAGAAGTTTAPTAPVSGLDTLTKDQKAQEYWLLRTVAFVVDAIIVYIVLAVVTAIIAIPALLSRGFGFIGVVFGGIALLWGIVFVLYFSVFESSSGSSIGKKVFKLKVVSKTGSNPTFGEALIRNISKIYWLLLLLDIIVGLATSKEYQEKYSDRLMGTKVTHS